MLVAELTTVTRALATIAFCGSNTVPEMLPPVPAQTRETESIARNKTKLMCRILDSQTNKSHNDKTERGPTFLIPVVPLHLFPTSTPCHATHSLLHTIPRNQKM